jgi:hypothetical protein
MRHGERQGTAGERHAVRDQACAEFGEESLGARRGAGCIDQPCQRRTQLHGPARWQGPFIIIIGTW